MNIAQEAIAGILRSHQTTKALAALVVGVNSAYILRHGSAQAMMIGALLLALAAAAIITAGIMGAWESRERRNQEQEEPLARQESSLRSRRGYSFENAMLAFVLAASLLGIMK